MSSDKRDDNEERHPNEKSQLSLSNGKENCGTEGVINHLDVFVGSLTFTSEQLAASLAEKAKQTGVIVAVQSLDEFKPEQYLDSEASHRVAVFVVSTHAAGKPSPNAERFLLWLRKASNPFCSPTKGPPQVDVMKDANVKKLRQASAPADKKSTISDQSPRKRQVVLSQSNVEVRDRSSSLSQPLRPRFHFKNWCCPFIEANPSKSATTVGDKLQGFHYAVFGVGNSIYRTFNATAKYVDERLQELGAVRVCPLGSGDISKSVDTTFEKWAAQLLHKISKPLSIPAVCQPAPAQEPSTILLPLHRPSRPGATPNQNCGGSEVPEGGRAKRGPTLADIELPIVTMHQQHGHRTRQRRYSSATTMILARRGSFETSSSTCSVVPPLAVEVSKK